MKYFKYILLFTCINVNAQINQCYRIPMSKWVNKGGLHDKKVQTKYLIFEKYFNDSIKVVQNEKTIASKFIKTDRNIEASTEFITIESKTSQKLYIYLKGKCYFFYLKKRYKYYYFNQFENNIGIQYSNYQREYY